MPQGKVQEHKSFSDIKNKFYEKKLSDRVLFGC